MLSQEILDLYKKSRLMTYRAMFGRIREKTGSLSATEAYAVDVIYLLGSPTITQLAETLGISQPNATYKVNNLVPRHGRRAVLQVLRQLHALYRQRRGRAPGGLFRRRAEDL